VDKLLLSPKEAAEVLSVSRSKLYELLAAGTLRSVRIDGCRRISVEVLRTYVEQLGSGEPGVTAEFAA
jgi:excisionase family DNA binding protein